MSSSSANSCTNTFRLASSFWVASSSLKCFMLAFAINSSTPSPPWTPLVFHFPRGGIERQGHCCSVVAEFSWCPLHGSDGRRRVRDMEGPGERARAMRASTRGIAVAGLGGGARRAEVATGRGGYTGRPFDVLHAAGGPSRQVDRKQQPTARGRPHDLTGAAGTIVSGPLRFGSRVGGPVGR